MEAILRPIYQERASSKSTLSILLIEKRGITGPNTDTFDYVLFVIVSEAEDSFFVKHYTYQHMKAALHIVEEKQLRDWLLLGTNRKVVDWVQNGKILFDRNEYAQNLKEEIRDFPISGRKLKMGIEFSKLIRRYMDGKKLFENEHYLDAYNNVAHALHHLARLEVIDKGFFPEVTVWNQVKQIEPEIYKLYNELVNSEESLKARLELLFLASEFQIYSRTGIGSQHLLEIMSTRDELWTIFDLMDHPEVKYYAVDLTVLLEYLIGKKVISTIEVETKGNDIYHRYYQVEKFEE